MGQTVKLRRSAVAGKKPLNSQLELGELSVNTTDGKVFLAKSGSQGPSVEELIITNTQNTGSIDLIGSISASFFTGSFVGDGRSLYNIPASGVTGLSLDQIANGSSTASIDNDGLQVNTDTSITGSLTATEFTGSGLGLTNVPFYISGSDVNGSTYGKTFTKLQFDDDTGLNVSESAPGTAFISIGSHYRDIFVNGSEILRATGSDSLEIVAAGGLEISTSLSDTNGNGYTKELKFDITNFSSSIKDQFDIITGSLSSSGEGRTARLEVTGATSTWTFDHNLNEQYPSITVFDSDGNVIIPQNIEAVSSTQLVVSFASPQTGIVTATVGGGLPTLGDEGSVLVVSGSLASWKSGFISGSGQVVDSLLDRNVNFGIGHISASSFTGSFVGDGSQLYNIPASGVTGLSLDKIANGSATASISPTGLVSNVGLNITGSIVISGTVDGVDVSSLKTSYDTTTGSFDGRLDSLETESGSIRTTFNSYTSSNNTTNTTQNNRLTSLETATASLSGDITTLDGRIDSLETESGSIRTDFNAITSSFDGRLDSLETESGSIRSTFNTYTSSNDITNTTQNSRLTSLESATSSLSGDITTLDGRVDSLETTSGSHNTRITDLETFETKVDGGLEFTGSNVTIKGDLLVKGTETRVNSTTVEISDNIISLNGSGVANAGIEVRDVTSPGVLSGSLLWDGLTNQWKGGQKGSEERILLNSDLTVLDGRLDSLETESGSIRTTFNSYTSSNNTTNTTQNNRLSALESESGSIRSDFNTVTSSFDGRLDSLETESGSIRTAFNSYTSSNNTTNTTQNSRLDSIEGVTGSFITGYTETQTLDDVTTLGSTTTNTVTVGSATHRGGQFQVNDYNSNTDGIRVYGYSNNEMLSLISRYDQADGGLFFKRGNNGSEATIGEINWVSNQLRINAQVGSLAIMTGGSTALSIDSNQVVSLSSGLNVTAGNIDMGTNNITDTKVGQWDTAYSWGNHSDAGYITGYTNTYLTGATFNTTNGIITFTKNDGNTVTVDIDGKYAESAHNHDSTYVNISGDTMTGNLTIRNATPSIILQDTDTSNPVNQSVRIYNEGLDVNLPDSEGLAVVIDTTDTEGTDLTPSLIVAGNVYTNGGTNKVWHDGNFTSTNISNWNTAYGWGDHSAVGYITGYTETDTLATVTARGATTSDAVEISNTLTLSHSSASVVFSGNSSGNFTIDNNTGSINFQANGSTVNSMTITSSLITLNENVAVNGSIDMGTNTITDTKVGQWDTAYGWGDHGSVGYITGYTETDTLNDVTSRGAIANTAITIKHNGVGLTIQNTSTSGADTGLRIRGARNGQAYANDNLTSYMLFSNSDDNSTPGEYDLAKIGAGMYDADDDTGYFQILTNNGTALTKALDIDKNQNSKFYGDMAVEREDDSTQFTFHRGGTNLSTDQLISQINFTADYNGSPIPYARIDVDTNSSGVRADMDFVVKSTSGTLETALKLQGGSAKPKAYFYNNVDIDGSLIATTIVKDGGTSSQFLMADGSTSTNPGWLTGYTNTYLTGATFSANTLTLTRNDGNDVTVNLNALVDVTVTGGTYSDTGHTLTLNKSDGNSIDITGFTIDTNTYITGHTWDDTTGVITSTRNNGTSITVDIDGRYLQLDGGTITGVIDAGNSNTAAYRFDGRSFSWNSSMQTPTTKIPHIMQKTYSGWDPIIGIKTTNGFWQMGAYSNDEIHFGYMSGAFGSHTTNAFDNSFSITPSTFKIGNVGAMNLTVNGTITATGYNNSNWDTAYTYSQVGHLPLAGGTMTGGLIHTTDDYIMVRSSTNGNTAGIRFSDHQAGGYTQYADIVYRHVDTASYGSGNSFEVVGTESTMTFLVRGKVMYTEGIYTAPATGTGAGTRKDTNWDTAYGWGNHANGGYASSGYLTNTSGAKLEIQNAQDGGSSKGIYMWTSSDTNWGIYMSQAGANKSLADGTAAAGLDGRTEHAIRFRVNDSTTQMGFLWENSSETALMQLQPNTGNLYVAGTLSASGYNKSNWDTAFGWGDHSTQGYLTSVTNISGYSGTLIREDNRTISPSELTSGRLKFGFTSWGNNNTSPYADFIHMRSYTDSSGGSDNLVMFKKDGIGMRLWQQTYGSTTAYSSYADVWTSNDFTSTNVSNWNTAYGWGNHASAGYLTSYTESDTLASVTGRGRLTSTDGSAVWDATTPGTGQGNIHIMSVGTDHAGGAITFDASDASNAQAGIYVKSDGSYGTKMYFATTDSYAAGSKSAIEIDHSGVVNILRNALNGSTINGSTIYASSQLQAGGTGQISPPVSVMKMNAEGIQFGGANNGRETNSAQISAGWHQANSLNIVGMSSDTSSANRRVDIWAEAGLYMQGGHITTPNMYVDGYIYHNGDTNTYIRFVGADDLQLVAGGRQMLRMTEGTDPDRLRFVTDSDWTDSSGAWNMSGNVTVGGTLTESSSIRYKEDVIDLDYGLNEIMSMRPVTYKKKNTGDIEVGLIAEEIKEIVPEVIKYNKEGLVDGLNYSRLTSILVNAIKELNIKVIDLENRLNG